MALTRGTCFATNYRVEVAGIRVTSDNYTDVLGDGLVSYDPTTHTLYLNGADIRPERGVKCIENLGGTLKIHLESYNYAISSDNIVSIYSEGNLIIEGSGSLEVSGRHGIVVEDGYDLTIRGGCTINACSVARPPYGATSAITGRPGGTCTIDKAWVNAYHTGYPYCPLIGFSYMNLIDCVVRIPEGAVWDEFRFVVDGNEFTTTEYNRFEIIPTPYHFDVNGASVNRLNYTDILGDSTAYYDPINNILTLDNANITSNFSGLSIHDDLIVKLIGNNSFTCSSGIDFVDANVTLQGPGFARDKFPLRHQWRV